MKKCKDCGGSIDYEYIEWCDSCLEKSRKKDLYLFVVGALLSVVLISVLIALGFQFQHEIGTFFEDLEQNVSSFHHSLPYFLQKFIESFIVVSLFLFMLILAAFQMLKGSW